MPSRAPWSLLETKQDDSHQAEAHHAKDPRKFSRQRSIGRAVFFFEIFHRPHVVDGCEGEPQDADADHG